MTRVKVGVYPRRCEACGRVIRWEPVHCFDCRAKFKKDVVERRRMNGSTTRLA